MPSLAVVSGQILMENELLSSLISVVNYSPLLVFCGVCCGTKWNIRWIIYFSVCFWNPVLELAFTSDLQKFSILDRIQVPLCIFCFGLYAFIYVLKILQLAMLSCQCRLTCYYNSIFFVLTFMKPKVISRWHPTFMRLL